MRPFLYSCNVYLIFAIVWFRSYCSITSLASLKHFRSPSIFGGRCAIWVALLGLLGSAVGQDTGSRVLPSALPTPVACFTDGTAKDVKKMSALYGNFDTFYTLDEGDHFGLAAGSLGDIDSDGVGDLAVGAYNDDDGGINAGAVYLLLLESNGNVKNAQKLSMLYGSFSAFYTLKADDGFGTSIVSLGDIDGDGVVDLAIGAFRDDDGGTDSGAVYVVFLDTMLDVKGAQKLSMNHSALSTFYTLDAGDEFGHSVTSLNDINGDGEADVAVGARTDNDGGTDAGAVYILFLDTNGNITDAQKLSALYGDVSNFYTLVAGDKFGNSVASLGDLDGDNEVDLAVGSYYDTDGGTGMGAVYMLFLINNCHVKNAQKISMLYGGLNVFYTLEEYDHYGSLVTALGDINGDGTVDLAVGAVYDDDGVLSATCINVGAVYIHFLKSNGKIKNAQKISMLYGNFSSFYMLDAWDRLGHSAAALGDIDGDGVMDLAVGAYGDDDGVSGTGAVYVINLEQTYCETLVILQLRILIISFFSALLFFCA